ncbi:RCC1 domain-containing protein [Rhodoferax sp.]|uniref:RCC1 domain-containing protein n=1 Tax=Rhodoferax sp. TaxID=50421 RepID=UPI00374D8BE6
MSIDHYLQGVRRAVCTGLGLLLAGCAISVPQPTQNATIAGPTTVVITGNASYSGLKVDVDGRDFTANMVASGSQRHDGSLPVPTGTHRLTASADVYCWYCSGSSTHSVVTRDFNVVEHLFTLLSAGAGHSCAIDTAQQMFCWGDNLQGQLGSGSVMDQACPTPVLPAARCQPNGVAVSGGHSWRQVSAGQAHTCGLDTTGAVFCWGSNRWGQLGNASVADSRVPVPVAAPPQAALPFKAVSVGANHSCALDNSGQVFCWGDNRRFQLGVANLADCPPGSGTADACSTTPVRQGAYTGGSLFQFIEVSAGGNHTCAANGQNIKCWGENSNGELGQGTHGAGSGGPSGSPSVLGSFLPGVSAGEGHSCALRAASNGTSADCWGDNHWGQLGGGWPATGYDTPQPVARPGAAGGSLSNFSAGGQHSCALFQAAAAGSLRVPTCAGLNSRGQLGLGPVAVDAQPHRVLERVALASADSGADFFQVSAGASHSCALKLASPAGSPVAGAVLCWGDNSFGQAGQNYQPYWDAPTGVRGL